MTKRTSLLGGLALTVVALAGCSSGAAPTTTQTTSASASASASAPASGGSATSAGGPVDPNSASAEELVGALTAAGVANADRWAREIQEYGPYSATELKATLTRELAKYNIAPDQLGKLLSALRVS